MAAANFVDDRVELSVPTLPDRYRVQRRLGGGAQGETFAVVDTHDGAERVLKLFAAGVAGQGSALAEFRSLETLIHPAIVRVRDIGRARDGRLYLVTDRVVGSPLDRVTSIADEAQRRVAFARVAVDLTTALAHLHGRGIMHGDVSPGNVRVDEQSGDACRAVLIDFGLAGPALAGGAGARGTLGYAAPEALTGARTPASDLFGLGATLFEAWSGAPPFGRGLIAAQRTLAGPPPALSSIRPGLGAGWDRLLDRLLAGDPAERPTSARVVLREIARLTGDAFAPDAELEVPHPDGDPLAGAFVGRRPERRALRAVLEALAEGTCAHAVVTLVGAPGSGRRTLFEAVARELAVAGAADGRPPVDLWRGDLTALERWLLADQPAAAEADDAARALEHRLARLARALESRSPGPLCVYLEEGEAAGTFARFLAGAAPAGRVLVVAATLAPLSAAFATAIDLPPFGADDIAALTAAGLGQEAPAASAAAILLASGGNAAVASALIRRLIANVRSGATTSLPLGAGQDLDALLAEGFAALSPAARQLLLAVALVGEAGHEEVRRVSGLDEGAAAAAGAAARRAGWLQTTNDGAPLLPSAAHRRVVLADGGESARAIAARALSAGTLGPEHAADALLVAGRPGEAAQALREEAGRVAGDPVRVAGLLNRALAVAPLPLSFAERIVQATGLGALGRYADAGGRFPRRVRW